jgi:hypothetical protein
MAPRLELQTLLETITPTVYFQPPANVSLTYPCIVYKRDAARTEFADNEPYARKIRYQVTVIDKNPDSTLPDQVAALPMCLFDRFYTADNLNHDVFNIFF